MHGPCSRTEAQAGETAVHVLQQESVSFHAEIPLVFQEGESHTEGLIFCRIQKKSPLLHHQILPHRRPLHRMKELNGEAGTGNGRSLGDPLPIAADHEAWLEKKRQQKQAEEKEVAVKKAQMIFHDSKRKANAPAVSPSF